MKTTPVILVLSAALPIFANQANAQNNEPPPAGPVVLNLKDPVPHTYQQYTTSFRRPPLSPLSALLFGKTRLFLGLTMFP